MTEEDTVDQSKKKGLFGLEKIQCFRRSFLTGISGGLGCGAVYFLCTSNTKRLLPVSVSSYAVITLGTWILCRYQRASERIKAREYRQVLGLQNIIITKDSRKT